MRLLPGYCRLRTILHLLLACPVGFLVFLSLIGGLFPNQLYAQTLPPLGPDITLDKPANTTFRSQRPKPLILSDSEKRWLAEHTTIRLGINPTFEPIEFMDDEGNYAGIAADYVKLLTQKLGIYIQVKSDVNLPQALNLAQEGGIDIFAAITPNQDRKRYLQFTRPYFKYPTVIYTRSDFEAIPGIESLSQKKIAVIKDHFIFEVAQQYYPNLELIPVESTLDGLQATSEKRVDGFMGDVATVTFEIRKHGLTDLKIAAPARFESHGHAFAVRKDWPELASMINKVMDTISPEQHLYISNKWVQIEARRVSHYWFWMALGAAGLILLFIILSMILRAQVRKKTAQLLIKEKQVLSESIERKLAERALISSEQRLTQFFHATFEAVFIHDNGNILDVNPATTKMVGYTPEEIIGKDMLALFTEHSRQDVMAHMSEGGVQPYEADIITKAGIILPVEIHPSNFKLKGEYVMVVGLRDITERKRNEQALRHAYAILETRVDTRTAELSLANTKLQDMDRLKSLFVASVSHELRTPLNSIIGFSSMMMQNSFGELNQKYTDYITRINHSGQHLLSLITDIIDISKIESGYVEVELSDFDLDDIVAEALYDFRQQAEKKGLSLEVIIPQGLTLHCDRRRLLQCLLNFISNAIKYSEQGQITVFSENVGQDLVLSVRDTGIGISAEDMPLLFEAFERIDTNMRMKAGGTGLGLYLTKQIATALLHGEVGANSEFGKGSTFWIKIPRIL